MKRLRRIVSRYQHDTQPLITTSLSVTFVFFLALRTSVLQMSLPHLLQINYCNTF